mmetsp:Transcript_53383/g.68510  ORF Transcript_53383/g.68510 Transcript_53383/m.68510 type:complete len:158 (+) Transcript_53383:103-576(+)
MSETGFCFSFSCMPTKEEAPLQQISPKKEGSNPKTLFNLALAMQAEGELTEACQLYEKVVKIDSDFHDAWYNLGHIKEEQGDSCGASKCIGQALRINPNDKESHLLMAYALESQDNILGALSHYSEAQRLDPKCSATLYNLANAFHDLHRLEDATKC